MRKDGTDHEDVFEECSQKNVSLDSANLDSDNNYFIKKREVEPTDDDKDLETVNAVAGKGT